MRKPRYFEKIRAKAEKRWDQLESDPELAGPFRQQFRQVQSPRHVLSELLQNADDAGANSVRAWVEDNTFIFEHDGKDFTEDQFASLCRFGYSNKRTLHTIGFRGIGFKSLFSLGNRVELYTPTLSIYFDKKRFFQPHWLSTDRIPENKTQIRVPIIDATREQELKSNFETWRKNPLSLLFFRSIRMSRIEETDLVWHNAIPGPVPNSEWLAFGGNEKFYLVVRSKIEDFPEEAIQEIQEERDVGGEDLQIPSCQVELVLNAKGRLYVVLPTGVETELPFAINAPFIQDPARVKLKDPATSPTNRWLLERAGNLAADTMVQWLNNKELPVKERAIAYDLMPDVDRGFETLEQSCATYVENQFEIQVKDQPVLLTERGKLNFIQECVILPTTILDVWDSSNTLQYFDDKERLAISRHISITNRQKLLNWEWCDNVGEEQVVNVLRKWRLFAPSSNEKLLKLWDYLADRLTGWKHASDARSVCILPVEGSSHLYSASQVIRLDSKFLPTSEQDQQFILNHLNLLSEKWLQFLKERGNSLDTNEAASVQAAQQILGQMSLSAQCDLQKVFDQVCEGFFSQDTIVLMDAVRLAQIASKWKVRAGTNFQFFTREGNLQSNEVLYDPDGELETLIPDNMREKMLLHDAYTKEFLSCTKDEWEQWVRTDKSGLFRFIPLKQIDVPCYGYKSLAEECKRRGLDEPSQPTYASSIAGFSLSEKGFDPAFWQYWEQLSKEREPVWDKIVRMALDFYSISDLRSTQLKEYHRGNYRPMYTSETAASWVIKLRDLPCLPDADGVLRKPSELLRRTQTTEVMMGIEPFLHHGLDKEAFHSKLDAFGVRTRPMQPEIFLERLRSLAKTTKPPLIELEKLYQKMDRLLSYASEQDIEAFRKVFHLETLIFSSSDSWERADSIFLFANEQAIPGAKLIRQSLRSLSLWNKVGVSDQPSIELAIHWLKTLETNKKLSPDDLRRVRSILPREPAKIWNECRCWINLSGEWVTCEKLRYGMSMQSLLAREHLFESVKKQTADFQFLPVNVLSASPFCDIPSLSSQISERVEIDQESFVGNAQLIPWLNTFGKLLYRIKLPDQTKSERISKLGLGLSKTKCQQVHELKTTAYIESECIGAMRPTDIAYLQGKLYITTGISSPKLAKRLPEEIGKLIEYGDITAALSYCFERTDDQIQAYMEENFELNPVEELDISATQNDSIEETQDKVRTFPETGDEPTSEGGITIGQNEGDLGGSTSVPTRRRRTRGDETEIDYVLPKPSLIERFALSQGFHKQGDTFCKEDGSLITRAERNDVFSWILYSASRKRLCNYLPLDKCLEIEAIELDSEAWRLLNEYPSDYSLILLNEHDQPIERTGKELKRLVDERHLALFPASYRIKMETW